MLDRVFCAAMVFLSVCALVGTGCAARAADAPEDIPSPMREFRGVWVASVANIDWPSRPALSTEQQKLELLKILDTAAADNLNAVILQVRPAADALYPSDLEPWSEYLTGAMGKAPSPVWDPLEFAVQEGHKRGLEIHAWFNPYRARHPSAKSPVSADHLSKTRPELVRQYGQHLWMDPGEPGVQEHSLAVIRDVIRRYDLDGIHIDDYFYPYKERDASGKIIDFPDEESYQRYRASGGTLAKDDWRRHNVDSFVESLYKMTKQEKPWVKFGISPFGIWQPGYPANVKGFNAYQELYADARKWLNNGWVDYFTPQIYFRIGQSAQPYKDLLRWWCAENTKQRHVWPGNYTSQIGNGAGWTAQEIVDQVKATRAQRGADGNIHFSMKAFLTNRGGVAKLLDKEVYQNRALIPASPWLDNTAPQKPNVNFEKATHVLSWSGQGEEKAFLWVIYQKQKGQWSNQIVPAEQTSVVAPEGVEELAVSAVDRTGNESQKAVIQITQKLRFSQVSP